MTGWLILLLLLALAAGALWAMRVRGAMLNACGAALLIGAAGYALQGRPGLPSAPADDAAEHQVVPLAQARHAFFGNFSGEESWLAMSEALARDGDTENAVNILRNAVGRYPGNVQLWIGLGNALVDHARGLTPPAELAYRRAAGLAPGHPAPLFFYGLALARSGDPQTAAAIWRNILATAPAKADWRPLVEQGVMALGGQQAAPPQRQPGPHPAS
ncbi:tetratricopeptide repeat protein [Sphingomonas sp.]|uniref:tetratricopeptide repeat protein n=1 Tax=Sphingomonas sp. TaxID=28214 RepID=UPI0025EFD469|nr:tetratricopeptide repeat protein [Sphingomonas sp.]MBV9528814.1 tetratricopeptide repeat protein [Sphingomonas sp.]